MFKTLLVCLVLLVIGGAGFGAYKLIPLYEDYKSQIEGSGGKQYAGYVPFAGGKLYL